MVSAAIGVELRPYEGDSEDLFARFLGLELSLHVCELDDDREIDFSRYGFILSTRTAWGAADLRAYQLEATALAAYALFVRGTTREGMLVLDVQRLLARYSVSSAGEVGDSVSGATVAFPDHFQELRLRIGGAAG